MYSDVRGIKVFRFGIGDEKEVMYMQGILPLWKEKGMTSHDCVFKLRKILRMKKIGHTGTLDPNVDGVLPICLGSATRIAAYITDSGKEYEAVVSIGTTTETEDADGVVVEQDLSMKKLTRTQIEEALAQLTGKIDQTPPMYSAVKVNGKRLYEYARKGIEVERPTRQVYIESIELRTEAEQFEGETITFPIRVKCGKGTYIRTLAVQIGQLLGYPAHMASLTRTMSGSFEQQQCVTLAEVEEKFAEGQMDDVLLSVEKALEQFPFIELDSEKYAKIKNGQVLPKHAMLEHASKIVFTKNGRAVAVYIQHPTKPEYMKPEKMFPTE